MTKRLQILLYVIAAYLGLFGVMFLFAPGAAEQFTKSIHDPSLEMVYGLYALVFGFISFLAAREKQSASRLSLVILLLIMGHVVVFGYQLLTGMEAFAQAGPPLIVNGVLAVLLFWFRNERWNAA